ncbi:flagellar basal body-associated protein FliL [Bacillus piscicola]|uniref:flagellar basal body-associated protein FliL n=1 Tax=Bacillus piscicola TaxID=1632684 RepID=UPI001F08B7CC|nr:flagellar basal body-associated protein FliL [Bacillus piscicola]
MFQNRLVNIMLILLLSLTCVGVIALVIMNFISTPEAGAEPTIDEIIENSWETEEITTNLQDNHFLKARFQIHTDSKEARKELAKRDFQVNNIIIHELAGRTADEVRAQEGLEDLEKTLRSKINEKMQEGQVVRVYTTDRIVQ